MNVNLMLLRAPCPGPDGGIRGTGRADGTGCPVPGQHPRWKVDQLPDGTVRWTAPSGRSYTTEPTRYPI